MYFRAKDPQALAAWYRDHPGITPAPASCDEHGWRQEAGPTAFAPFPETTTYFGNAAKTWMVNLRVRDLDAIVAQLRAAGVLVEIDAEPYPNGHFARLNDPKGNPIELWQPQ